MTPCGSVVVSMVNATEGASIKVYDLSAVMPDESVALIVMLNVPDTLDVPLIAPLVALSVRPVGNTELFIRLKL